MTFILSPMEYIGFVEDGKVIWYCCKYDGKIATITKESANRSELEPVWTEDKEKKQIKKKKVEKRKEQSLLQWVK